MVALITDIVTNEPLNLHRTWLAPDGSDKASVDRPRLLLKGHRKAGGVVRLSADDDVTLGLGIGEGLETCLSVLLGFRPVWCVIDAGNLGLFPVLDGIEALTIFADRDFSGTGQRAADQCAARWHAAGREVRVFVAPMLGQDFNDMVREAAHAA